MNTNHRRPTLILTLAVILGLAALFLPSVAFAQDPGGPPSGDGIDPTYVAGNPSCATLNANNTGFPNITSNFGFKLNGSPIGTFPFTAAYGELTGSAPPDPLNAVTISQPEGESYFNWQASLGIDAVIVKGGPNADAFVYVPEDTADTQLHAPINPDNGQPYGISHIEFCYDYELTATKTASATYKRTYTWTIAKEFDREYKRFIGDPAISHGYKVTVDQSVVDSDWSVSGNIVVNNPTPFTVSFSVTDLVGSAPASVTCPTHSLAPGASTTCTYNAALGGAVNGTNTATITSNTAGVGGATASADYTFGEPTTVVGDKDINVTDTNGKSWQASDDAYWEYTKDFTCPTDQSLYANGVYVAPNYVNTATIVETGQQDTATVKLTCYAPVVRKDATAEWRKLYEWDITKEADPTSHTGFPGDSFQSAYDVTVDQTVTDYGFKASGTIYVTNPAGAPAAMTVNVADAVNGTPATLDCGGSLTVQPGTTATCGYTVDLPDNTDRTNTATVTFNTIGFPATASVVFGAPIVEGYPTVNVNDIFPFPGGMQGNLGSASGAATFEYNRTFTCSQNPGDYTNGVDQDSYPNRAVIVETGQYADETVTVTCYLPAKAKVIKTVTDGSAEIGQLPFTFTLYDPSGNAIESKPLNGAGELTFAADIKAAGVWKVVETLPTGWINPSLTCEFTVAFPASAGQTYTCSFHNTEQGKAKVVKTVQGAAPSGTQSFTFQLRQDASTIAEGTLLETQVANAANGGVLNFTTLLVPGQQYQMCEAEMLPGWDTNLGPNPFVPNSVLPGGSLNPNTDNSVLCVNFTAQAGAITGFAVDNTPPPGGMARTIGYWKNHASCKSSNGNQAPVLDQTLALAGSSGIVVSAFNGTPYLVLHGSTTTPDIAPDCADARNLLDKRRIDTGKKMASDPAFNLAAQLVAVQLNLAAGADPNGVTPYVTEAVQLLGKYAFNGKTHTKISNVDAARMNVLARILDNYNNNRPLNATVVYGAEVDEEEAIRVFLPAVAKQ